MNKDQARKLIRDTFQGGFDKDTFVTFLKNSFHSTNFSKTFHFHGQYIKDSFKEFIKSYERVGQYVDADGKVIDMLVVYLQKETSLVRARTAQRNFVARYLKDRGEKDAALVSFVAPDPKDWRFSFVKMEYRFEKTGNGAFKAKEAFTPAKRYSFLVGEHENSHTAQRQLVTLLARDINQPSLTELEDVFNIEKVSKEFFERYRELYLRIKESLDVNVENDSGIKEDFAVHGVDTVDFAKKLLGQIVFLYFLQKKGWFGVEKGSAWGSGPKGFLRKLFNKEIVDYDNFFNDILEPLFYEALAIDRGHSAYWDKLKCRIPFLNGGLFEPLNGYSWENTDILLDNKLFSNAEKTKQGDTGTGVLDVFDRFNFTVKEDEPLEKEVAVDPEMLGKVFENLLGVKDRKSKGAYYTPRQIVHYMCQESLINYLATECGEKVKKEELEEFIRHGEMVIEHEARIVKEGKETRDYTHYIGESVKSNAKEIDQKLCEIKVCDPAVGSGAFLVGMMNEIIRARHVISHIHPGWKDKADRAPYMFKRQAISHSLYGVDIDPGAVEIAKLRLWLSLVVDEEDMEEIKPLPNLDYKIMQGNSLLEEFEGIKLFDESLIEDALDNHQEIERLGAEKKKLGEDLLRLNNENKLTRDKRKIIEEDIKKLDRLIKKLSKPVSADEEPTLFVARSEAKDKRNELQSLYDAFPAAVSKTRKQELKARIEELEWDLIETTLKEQGKEDALARIRQHKQANSKPFFLWKLHFGEVFKDKGGFDVVIGNPPYLGFRDLNASIKNEVKDIFKSADGKFDLYVLFIEKSFYLLKPQGFFVFICPTAFTKRGYGKNIRNFLLENTQILELIDFEHDQLFDKATNYTGIFSFLKVSDNKHTTLLYKKGLLGESVVTEQDELQESSWVFISKETTKIVEKLKNGSKPLEEICSISEGIVTGLNQLYLLKSSDIESQGFELDFFHPCVRGKEIDKYQIRKFEEMVFYPYEKNENRMQLVKEATLKKRNPKYFGFLKKNQEKIHARSYFTKSSKQWYELWNQRKIENFHENKIITPELSDRNRFALSLDQVMYGDTVCGIRLMSDFSNVIDLYYLLGLLNSRLIEWFYKETTVPKAGGFFIYKNMYLKQIPIRIGLDVQQGEIAKIVKKIMAAPTEKTSLSLMAEIDEIVFNLYGLTEEEKKIVRNG